MPNIGPLEIILILLVLVLLFGAKKLPELARGSGRALRIFKAETKGLMDDDDETTPTKTPEQRAIEAQAQTRAADDIRYEQELRPEQEPRPEQQPRPDGDR